MHGDHLGDVTLTFYIKCTSFFTGKLHIVFGFDWPGSFKDVRNNMTIYVYLALANNSHLNSAASLITINADIIFMFTSRIVVNQTINDRRRCTVTVHML